MGVAPPRKISGFHVYCDESNTDSHKRYMVYGGILVSLDNLPKVERELANWRVENKIRTELAWTKVSGGKYAEYKSLVDLFFSLSSIRRIVHFKAIVLDTVGPQYLAFSRGDKELGFYKFYYHFLLRYFGEYPIRHRCQMEVFIDERALPKGSDDPYEVLKIVLNHGIRKKFSETREVVARVEPLASMRSDLIQLGDVLMGAIGYQCLGMDRLSDAKKAKVDLAKHIAKRGALLNLTQETPYNKEYFKVERWYWGPRPPRRRKPSSRRAPTRDQVEP
jgi:hypothetical protein